MPYSNSVIKSLPGFLKTFFKLTKSPQNKQRPFALSFRGNIIFSYLGWLSGCIWEFIFGDGRLIHKIIKPLGHKTKERNDEFMISYAKMINLFTLEFSKTFCKPDDENRLGNLADF